MKKRVLFLLTQDLTSPSGLGRYLPMSKGFAASGWDLWIAALHGDYGNLDLKRLLVDGVRVEYVAQMHVDKKGNRTKYFGPLKLIWRALQGTISLYKACLRARPDLIVIGKPHPMNSLAALAYRLFHPCKLVLDCDDLESESNFIQHEIYRKILAFFEKQVPQNADLVTTNTQLNLERMVKVGLPASKLVYLPNGVDLERFPDIPESETLALRQQLALGDAPVIGYVGSMNLANHSVDLLLQAFAVAYKDRPDVRLLLVGGGKDLDNIRTLARDLDIDGATIAVGRVDPSEVNSYTRICNIAVDPVRDSMAERGRCPLKIFEAWAAGVPFVTMDVGDRRLLAGDPPAVVLTDESPVRFAETLLSLLDDFVLQAELKRRMAARRDDISWDSRMKSALPPIEALIENE